MRQPSSVDAAAVRWRQEANNQQAEARKRELLAMVTGGITGASTGRDAYIHKALKDALRVYRQELRAGIEAIRNASPNAPSGLPEATGRALRAHDAVLQSRGVRPADAYGQSLMKKIEFLNNEADRFGAMTRIDAGAILERARTEYTGKGYTADANGNVGFREFLVRNQKIADASEFAMLPLRAGNYNPQDVVAVNRAPQPYNPAVVTRGEVGRGLLMGGSMGAVTTLAATFGDVRAGRTTWNEAARTLPNQLANQTALGAGIGTAETIIEGSATRGIALGAGRAQNLLNAVASNTDNAVLGRLASRGVSAVGLLAGEGTTMLGAVARRGLGSGLAGGIVNGGIASFEQYNLYQAGRVSGSQAIGTVVGESAVGIGAGLSGAALGATVGSVIPGLGTVVGGVVGFGVGMAAGYVADKGLRGLGVDKAIARGVTATIEGGQQFAADAKQVGARTLNQIQTAGAQAVTQARAVGTRAVNQGRAVVNQAVSTTRAAVRSQINAARDFGNRVSTGARSYAQAKLTQARQTFSQGTRAVTQMYTQAKQQVTQTVNRTVERASQTYQQASSYVSNTVNRAQQSASNFVNNATSSLRSAFGW